MSLGNIDNVLFDLDGTLVDSSGTITASLIHALDQVGAETAEKPALHTFIGKPLLDIFQDDFELAHRQAIEAIDIYREHYDRLNHAGTTVYQDVQTVLEKLAGSGFSLFVATVKPTRIAEKVLDGMKLRTYFSGVAGASMGPERRDKSQIIAHALKRYGLEPTRSLMVGDRRQDIEGAHENRLRALGVSYGFGSREELESAGPLAVVGCSADIASLLLGEGSDLTRPRN